ncbi:MAG: hypothetical protein WC371_01985 [Parachlamydiales bacterium]|jgi:hypothetical protein
MVASVLNRAFDAIAHQIDKHPKDGLKSARDGLSWTSYINTTLLNEIGRCGSVFKALKTSISLWAPLELVVELNNFRHKVAHLIETPTFQNAQSAALASIDTLKPLGDSTLLLHDFSILTLPEALPVFASLTIYQFIGFIGTVLYAGRFLQKSRHSYRNLTNFERAQNLAAQMAQENPNAFLTEEQKNEFKRLLNDGITEEIKDSDLGKTTNQLSSFLETKHKQEHWKLAKNVAILALNTLALIALISGFLSPVIMLSLSSFTLLSSFAVQYIEEPAPRPNLPMPNAAQAAV